MNIYRQVYTLLLFLLLTGCGSDPDKSFSKKLPTDSITVGKDIYPNEKKHADTSFINKSISKQAADDSKTYDPTYKIGYDTTYKIGSYLIRVAKWMKYDVIDRHNPNPVIISKGDTLYKDKDTLILGDEKGIAKYP